MSALGGANHSAVPSICKLQYRASHLRLFLAFMKGPSQLANFRQLDCINPWKRIQTPFTEANRYHKEGVMGSSGSGRFSDYPGTKAKEVAGDGAGVAGGTSGVDKCSQAFHVLLEDVGNGQFYSQSRTVPPPSTQLTIIFDGQRVFAVDANGLKVGALPTLYNYLVACMQDGVSYVGVVTLSAASPVPTVEADFVPQ